MAKKDKKEGCAVCKACKFAVKAGVIATGALFTVYMLNLDQKVLGWTYRQVNEIFDRKEADVKF